MDDYVINKIKKFSGKHNISISKLAETLFTTIVRHENDLENNLSPITKKYKGIISGDNFSEDDVKYSYLLEKNK